MGVIVPNFASSTEDRASGALVIDGSLRFDSAKSHYLSRTPGSAGNRRTWTWSGWVKRGNLAASGVYPTLINCRVASNTDDTSITFTETDQIRFVTGVNNAIVTNAVYRDYSAWYHIVVAFDTTQSVSTDRIKLYVNGIQETSFASTSYPSQNSEWSINTTSQHRIGRYTSDVHQFSGLLANVFLIDGQALGPGYFGFTDPLTNTWRPKKFKPQATPNNGTTWSSTGSDPNSKISGGSIANVFSGSLSTGIAISQSSTNQYVTMTTGPIQCNSTVSFLAGNGLSTSTMRINGSDTYKFPAGSSTVKWWDFSFSGTITKIELGYLDGSGSSSTFYGIMVDGVPLLDNDAINIGKNGFYLPMDGNTPIGQDQSERGNNWTPVNFGGSNTIEKATGALPILNTVSGGRVATVGVRTDTVVGAAATCVVALPLVGNKNDFSNKVDSRSTEKTITNNGVSFSSTYGNLYGASGYFNGSGYLVTDLTSFNMDTDFTIEFWWYKTGTQTNSHGHFLGGVLGGTNSYGPTWRDGGSDFQVTWKNTSSPSVLSISGGVVLNEWHHYAFVYTKSDNSLRAYVDGVLKQTTTSLFSSNPGSWGSSSEIGRGGPGWSTQYVVGYVQDYRIYQGAKYTSNFIPASTNPDILPDTPSGVSGSSKLTKITDGAVAFDGSGDYLSIADSADFELGSGDFTIEFYVNSTQTHGSYYSAVSKFQSSNFSWMVRYSSIDIGTGWSFFWSTTGSNYSTLFGQAINDGGWHHIAVTRSGTTIRTFTDGVLNNSTTTSDTFYNGNADVVVGSDQGGNYFNGFISNLRVIKGTALYTSNFTPPTRALTAVANTKLLCCQSNTSATAATVTPGSITANGNAAATNFNPFTTDINTVRGQESGYCTWNPLAMGSNLTLEDGNLAVRPTSNNWLQVKATISVSSGKWYWESTVNSSTTYTNEYHGISDYNESPNTNLGTVSGYCYGAGGDKYTAGTNAAAGASYGAGDTIGMKLDLDSSTKTITYYKNGVEQFSQTITTTGPWHPASNCYYNQAMPVFFTNFGQKPFKFPPPDGFQPLNAANVRPSTVVARPDKYFGTAIYSGTSSGGTTVQSENINFTPDLVWVKARNAGESHSLYDSVRGYTKRLNTNNASQEATTNPASDLSGFIKGGFTVGGQNGHINYTGYNYVTWAWKAGGGSGSGGEFWKDDVQYANAAALNMSVGALNNSEYNQSQTWSNSLTSDNGFWAGQGAANAFDGTHTNVTGTDNGGTLTFAPSNFTIPANSTIEVRCSGNANGYTVTVNGVANIFGGNDLFTRVNYDGSTTLTSITIKSRGATSGDLKGIKVNGALLVDSTVTPPNAPSIALTGASVGTKQGFSIVTYTANLAEGGATIAHGLTQEPDFAIFKNRDSTLGTNQVDWGVYHRSIGATKKLELNQALISETHTGPFNNTEPTSSLFYFGGRSGGSIQGHSYMTNGPANDGFVGYIWHDVPGLQKFGSYIGNGGNQFIELGFRPKMLMIKQSTGTAYYWNIYDTERDPDNVCTLLLYPNTSNGDDTWAYVDILSNGFRPVVAGNLNELNSQVVYAAWAEAPTFNLFGAQSNAR